MRDVNTVVLIGRLTRDAELKYSQGGTAICSLSVAVTGSRKVDGRYEDTPYFFDCTYLGKGAEAVHKYLTKGKQVGINGELHQERWEKDGAKRSKVIVFVQQLQLLGGKSESGPAPSSQDDFPDDLPF